MPEDQEVHLPGLVHERALGALRVYKQMPTTWLVHGFGEAVDRLSAALKASSGDARDITIASFEAANWLDALRWKEPITGDPHIRALVYVRKRLHHQVAGAMDPKQDEWVWLPVESLPPVEEQHRDEAGESVYTEHLVGRPVLDAFSHARRILESRWPITE